MSLDKTKARLLRLRERARLLRQLGVLTLGEPGPWFSIQPSVQFDPAFFRGFLTPEPPDDKKFIGDTSA